MVPCARRTVEQRPAGQLITILPRFVRVGPVTNDLQPSILHGTAGPVGVRNAPPGGRLVVAVTPHLPLEESPRGLHHQLTPLAVSGPPRIHPPRAILLHLRPALRLRAVELQCRGPSVQPGLLFRQQNALRRGHHQKLAVGRECALGVRHHSFHERPVVQPVPGALSTPSQLPATTAPQQRLENSVLVGQVPEPGLVDHDPHVGPVHLIERRHRHHCRCNPSRNRIGMNRCNRYSH